jgi:hypothetical protein
MVAHGELQSIIGDSSSGAEAYNESAAKSEDGKLNEFPAGLSQYFRLNGA